MYKSTELALKPAPYAMPDSPGSASQLLAVSSTTSQLEFIDLPASTELEYEDLTSGSSLTINSTTGFKNYRLRHGSSVSNATIVLPRVNTGYSSGYFYPITWLNGKVMEIVNESSANISLYIDDVRESSSKNYARTTVYTSAGQVSPFDGAYTYTIGPRSRVYVAAYYSVASGYSSNAALDYTIIEAGGTGTDLINDSSPQLGGALDVNGHYINSTSNGNIEVDPNGTGAFKIRGNSTSGSGRIVLNCEDNSHGVTLKGPPHSAAANYTLTLPNDDGNADQVLKTDGSGNLSWVDQSSGGSAPSVTAQNTTATLSVPSAGTLEEVYTVNSSSAVTLTLVSAATVGEGFKYQIKRLGTGAVTVDPAGSEYIDHSGQSTFSISAQYDSITLISDATNWLLI